MILRADGAWQPCGGAPRAGVRSRRCALHARAPSRREGRAQSAQPLRATAKPKAEAQEEDPGAGSVLGASLLVAGTAVGAGVLALPAVTQESGFVASAAALAGGSAYSVAIGLLLAELYVNSVGSGNGGGGGSSGGGGGGGGTGGGSGSVAFAKIARSTLGGGGVLLGASAYTFLHVSLLVAYISKSSEVLGAALHVGATPAAALFVAAFGGLCYACSPAALDRVNGALVVGIIAAFFALLASAAGLVDPAELLRADWGAVPATLPVIALAFVYHNVVPVICTSLKGDPAKIRAAILGGVSVPLFMFILWNAAILGSLNALSSDAQAPSSPGGSATSVDTRTSSSSSSSSSSSGSSGSGAAPTAPRAPSVAAAAAAPPAPPLAAEPRAVPRRVADPLAALSAVNPLVSAEISAFSFLAVATSFIGFVLGLTDFVAGALGLPSRQAPVPYAITLLPPLALAMSFPGIFLTAIDTAGTYGVLTLFGILPCAMAWSARYRGGGGSSSSSSGVAGAGRVELVPGGKPVLVLLAGLAAAIIAKESAEALSGVL